MQNIVINMCEKFYNDRLRNDRSLGNGKSDNNKKNNKIKNNVRSAWRPVSGSINYKLCTRRETSSIAWFCFQVPSPAYFIPPWHLTSTFWPGYPMHSSLSHSVSMLYVWWKPLCTLRWTDSLHKEADTLVTCWCIRFVLGNTTHQYSLSAQY